MSETGETLETRPIRVLIVDDHEILTSSLALVLDGQPGVTTVGVAGTLARARR